MMDDREQEIGVGARPYRNVLIGKFGRFRAARIDDDYLPAPLTDGLDALGHAGRGHQASVGDRREKILPSRSRLTVRFAASARRTMRKPRKPVSRATGKAGHSISTWWSPPLSNWPTPAGSMKVTALDELGSGHLHPPLDRKSTRLNSSHSCASRMPSSA